MHIPGWRIALTGTALAILAVAGIGLANGATTRQGTSAPAAAADTTTAGEAAALDAALDAAPAAARDDATSTVQGVRLGARWLRRLVHAVVTIQGPDGGLYTIQLDRGKVTAVSSTSITLSEAGSSSVTLALNTDTKVRQGRERVTLDAVKVGADVLVQSRIDGSTLAKRIFIVPAR